MTTACANAGQLSVTLTASPNPAVYGGVVTLTAVIPAFGATGKVTFYDGVSVVGIAPVLSGTARFKTILLAAGARSLTAHYSGDPNYSASVSPPVQATITPRAAQGFNQTDIRSNLQFPSLAAGDFNGDGKLDFAATDRGTNTVQIFLGQGDGTFTAGNVYADGTFPFYLSAADLNGDGITDLLLIDIGSPAELHILFGKSDGSFQVPAPLPLTGCPGKLAAGDFNNDGIIDIAITNACYASAGVNVLIGKGDGTFRPAVSYAAPTLGPLSIGDFNGDGLPDLAVVIGDQQGDYGIAILLGKGDGSFGAAVKVVTFETQPYNLAVADFNKDGKADLAVNRTTGVSLLLGNGDGTFQKESFFDVGRPASGTIDVSDFNGDGNLDVIVETANPGGPPNSISGSFAILFGNGNGSFKLNPYHDNYGDVGPFVLGDFNGDGRVDLVEAGVFIYLGLGPADLAVTMTHSDPFIQGQQDATYSIGLQNDGPSTSFGQVILANTLPPSLTSVEMSGDGWSCSTQNCIRSDGLASGAKYPPVTLTVNVSSTAPPSVTNVVTISTVDQTDNNPANDSARDVTTIRQYQTIIFGSLPDRILGSGSFSISATSTSGLPVSFAASGACGLNGKTVLPKSVGTCTITASQAGNSLYFPADPVARTFTITSAPSSIVLSAKPNPVVFGAPITLTATVQPSNASGSVTFYDGTTILGMRKVASGSAKLTVRLTATGVRKFTARYNAAPTFPASVSAPIRVNVNAVPGFGFTSSNVPDQFYTGKDLAIGDFNGDGVPDIVTNSQSNVTVFLGKGNGSLGAAIETLGPDQDSQVLHVAVGDFNGDGKLDVVTSAQNLNQKQTLQIWLGKGDGTLVPGAAYTIAAGTLAIADFNQDGFGDIAVGHGSTQTVSVLINKRDGTFETPNMYPLLGFGSNVLLAAGDMNGDGHADLVAVTLIPSFSGNQDNLISILPGKGDGTFGPSLFVTDPNAGAGSVALGDLNGDGILDIAIQNGFSYTTSSACSITVHLGNGNGTFQPQGRYLCGDTYPTSANGSPAGMVIADFNGDGKADVAAIFQYNIGFLQLFPGNGDGTFQPPSVFQFEPGPPQALVVTSAFDKGRVDLAMVTGFGLQLLQGVTGPQLRIAKRHSGTVTTGQTGLAYTITVSNADGAATTSGEVSVTDLQPEYENITSMQGTGWNCYIWTCTRSDALAGGSAFPPITVLADVYFGATSPETNRAVASGGGSAPVEVGDISPVLSPGPARISAVQTSGGNPNIAQNDWIEIKGTNLVPVNTPASGITWNSAPDFAHGMLPTQLNVVSVKVNGKPAYVSFYCSAATNPNCASDQINVLTPLDSEIGSVPIVVSSDGASTDPFNANMTKVAPSFLLFPDGTINATHADYRPIGSVYLYPGISSPARPGETIILWAVGFGLPATALTPGSSTQSGSLPAPVSCTANEQPANAKANLVAVGLYQINVTLPAAGLLDGSNPVVCTYEAASTPKGLLVVQVPQ